MLDGILTESRDSCQNVEVTELFNDGPFGIRQVFSFVREIGLRTRSSFFIVYVFTGVSDFQSNFWLPI